MRLTGIFSNSSTLGTNFTSTNCPSFFATFLADPTFTACAPFSLLLTTSTAFFTAERSPYSLLPYVLDASCAADSTTCTALMDTLAREIKGTGACGADLALGNPLATEALQGFLNYRLYREVGCQKSNSTEGTYCFADAAANSQPDDLYTYYAGEGTSLPSGTTPDCGSCTQGLFAIYAFVSSPPATFLRFFTDTPPSLQTLRHQLYSPHLENLLVRPFRHRRLVRSFLRARHHSCRVLCLLPSSLPPDTPSRPPDALHRSPRGFIDNLYFVHSLLCPLVVLIRYSFLGCCIFPSPPPPLRLSFPSVDLTFATASSTPLFSLLVMNNVVSSFLLL